MCAHVNPPIFLLIQLPTATQADSSWLLWIVPWWTCECRHLFISFENAPQSGTAGWADILLLSVADTLICTATHVFLCSFWQQPVWTGMRWYHGGLICISQMTRDGREFHFSKLNMNCLCPSRHFLAWFLLTVPCSFRVLIPQELCGLPRPFHL